ncbi:6503_t:CDS:2 [Funneliformis geosporum]|uniref:9398_t:CDS:1 n=1 Tax=Funneliformis geosporum TaxID=1117311 RepID=A0A9W4SNC7_9GLOM|nr:6503_t:CDS:2 [Funneliformis geosporum]CAI2175416.1 9398_t:CDS:2 [Funneliformis geosporum]
MQNSQHIEGLNGILHQNIDSKISLSSTYQKLLNRLNTENMTKIEVCQDEIVEDNLSCELNDANLVEFLEDKYEDRKIYIVTT